MPIAGLTHLPSPAHYHYSLGFHTTLDCGHLVQVPKPPLHCVLWDPGPGYSELLPPEHITGDYSDPAPHWGPDTSVVIVVTLCSIVYIVALF